LPSIACKLGVGERGACGGIGGQRAKCMLSGAACNLLRYNGGRFVF
jgi:hypothetical protein